MPAQSNLKVFCFLRVLESIQCLICLCIHFYEVSQKDDPFKHEFVFCGTYFGFFLISLTAVVNHTQKFFSYQNEIFNGVCGCLLFITASIWSMVNVENDKNLISMTDQQEYEYFYFQINRIQSVASLVTTFLFLLQTVLALDYILTKDNKRLDNMLQENAQDELKLYFFPELIWNGLKKLFCRNDS